MQLFPTVTERAVLAGRGDPVSRGVNCDSIQHMRAPAPGLHVRHERLALSWPLLLTIPSPARPAIPVFPLKDIRAGMPARQRARRVVQRRQDRKNFRICEILGPAYRRRYGNKRIGHPTPNNPLILARLSVEPSSTTGVMQS